MFYSLGIDLLSPSIAASRRIDTNGDGSNENNTCYVRYKFNVADKNAVSFLNLRVKYDDGFVAFLNGVRVAARNAPSSLTWDAEATAWHDDSQALVFEDIDITAFRSSLLNGPNILAVQAMNYGDTSSDMLFSCELVDAAANGGGVGIPPSQPSLPGIAFGVIESNPASGDQDQEFIELINPNPYDLDISGWTLEGGVTHTLKGGTVIPAGESLYLSPHPAAFRTRSTAPGGGTGRFVQGNYSGHLSNLGESLALKDAVGTIMAQTITPANPSDAQLYLVLSEIMYHPAGNPDAEFLELLNISDTVTLDLRGVKFTDGIEFGFTGSAVTSLAPGERVLIVRSISAFEAVHGTGLLIAGEFANLSRLDNAGEILKLEDATNSTIQEVTYNDTAPWPVVADGAGASLHFIVGSTEAPGVSESERWFSLAPNPGSVPDDADGDGHSNLTEWLAGTNAADAASRFMISSIVKGGDGSILGSFQGMAGRTYRVFTSPDLTTWTPLGATIAPVASGIQTFTDATPGSGARFYKIATPAP